MNGLYQILTILVSTEEESTLSPLISFNPSKGQVKEKKLKSVFKL